LRRRRRRRLELRQRGCLWECNGNRTCELDLDAGCIHCDNVGEECRGTFCSSSTQMVHIESSTCTALQGGTSGSLTGDTSCFFKLMVGTDLGVIQEVSGGDFIADFPDLGGRCTGTFLPTNAERWVFNCPGCQFVVALF
jgi:hypothetical protein